jgi:hypothetical protein
MLVNSHYIFALPEEEASLLKWRMFWDKSPGVILVCNRTRKFRPGIARVQKLPKSDRVLQLHENGALALSLAGEGRVGGRWWRGGAYGGSEDTKVDEPGAWVHVSA